MIYIPHRFSKALHRMQGRFVDIRNPEVLAHQELEKRFIPGAKTVLYVAKEFDYADQKRGLGYEHYSFYQTLVHMNYALIVFPYDKILQQFGKKNMNAMLRHALYLYRPDILLYVHHMDWVDHAIWNEVSQELPVKTAILLADDYWRMEETRPVWELFNAIVTMDERGYEKRKQEGSTNVLLSQWGVSHFVYRDLGLARVHDVTFVGQAYGERPAMIETIRKNGVDVKTFGRGWPGSSRISQADLIKLYNQSKISFNSFITSKGNIGINARDFEAACCGSMVLTQDIPEIRRFFEAGKEAVLYKTLQEAAEKAKYYLSREEERKLIAKAGQERVLRDHTYERRLREILAFAERL